MGEFNDQLKMLTRNMTKLEGENYSSHSFRAGMATTMVRLKDIKLGRATRFFCYRVG